MNGELDFKSSLHARAALLNGVPANVFERLKSVISITPGARELCRALKTLGYRLAVLSGGFMPLAEWLAEQLNLDHVHANNVRIVSSSSSSGDASGHVGHVWYVPLTRIGSARRQPRRYGPDRRTHRAHRRCRTESDDPRGHRRPRGHLVEANLGRGRRCQRSADVEEGRLGLGLPRETRRSARGTCNERDDLPPQVRSDR